MAKKNYHQKFVVFDSPKKYIADTKINEPIKLKVKVRSKKPWSSDRLIKK